MKPDELEFLILKDIVHYHSKTNGLNLQKQLENIEVEKRDYTGFGIYVYFKKDQQVDLRKNLVEEQTNISSPTEFYLDTLEHQISFELNLNEKGQFDFLEIVPNGVESWNGKYGEIKKLQPTTAKDHPA